MHMPKWLKRILLALGCLSLIVVAGAAALFGYLKISAWREMKNLEIGGTSKPVNIIIISIDGGRPDALIKGHAREILRINKSGAYSFNAQTITPSWTVPAHISMATGLTPEHHGMRTNRFKFMTMQEAASVMRRYKNGSIKTVVDYAKVSRGMQTSLIISNTSDFQPELREFLGGVRNLDNFTKVDGDALRIAAKASEFLRHREPALLMVHFKEVDEAGHRYGWMSAEQLAAVGKVDASVGILLRALRYSQKRNNTYVIITADHGGHTARNDNGKVYGDHGTNSPEDMTIPWLISGPNVRQGHKIKSSVNICDTAATILHILGIPVPKEMDGKPVIEAFK